MDARASAKNGKNTISFSSPMPCNATMLSLVDLPAGRFQPPNPTVQKQLKQTTTSSNHSLTGYQGEHTQWQ
jgi:hypothetical protein